GGGGTWVCGGTLVPAPAGPVMEEDWRPEPLRQPLADQAGGDVGRAGRRDWHDQAHGARGIGLRPCNTRQGGQRGSARCEMEKISAGEVHNVPPPFCDGPRSATTPPCCLS